MSTMPSTAPREWRFCHHAETYAFRYGENTPPYLVRERRIGGAGEYHFGPTDMVRVGPGEFMWGADLLSAVIAGRDLGRDAGLRRAVVAYLTAAAEAVLLMSRPLVDAEVATTQPSLDHAA